MTDEAGLALNPGQARTATAIFERMFPADDVPGATEIGVVRYLDRALAGAYREDAALYRRGLAQLDAASMAAYGAPFDVAPPAAQDALVHALERGEIAGWAAPEQIRFFHKLRAHLQEGLFSDPVYGGNIDKAGWRVLGHPGVWLDNSAEENLSPLPADKGGRIQSLADVQADLAALARRREIPGSDPLRGAAAPLPDADVVLVGVGGVGGFIAPVLAKAGLRVVGLEAGPWWDLADFHPDELGHAYYCRAELGQKFKSETPRWRTHEGAPDQELTFSLGRMMNGVGGSVIHYGGWLRRFPAHNLRLRSHALERWGPQAIPEGCTTQDWPVTYEELRPYFTEVERLAGIAGDDQDPFRPRDAAYPLSPTRPFRMGELFTRATREMGLHPQAAPVGMTTQPYNGQPAMTYTAWNNGFGSWTGDKWHPALTSVPEALATGNFDLCTNCRVTRVLTDADGRACGVSYIDALGQERVQKARVVILAAYTFETVRLMFLSGTNKRPGGLGNSTGQLGKHFMTKMFAHVDGYFPDIIFNRHTGPAAQAVVLDDFLDASFDCGAYGFLGGSTLGAENQFLPIQIAREALPNDVPGWGQGYKDHLRQWQHFGVVRMQPEALSCHANFLDIDPRHRDRSGLGLPVVRVTYDLQPNEHRLAAFMEGKCQEILTAMGATKTWNGPRFTGAGSSHDLGGCRMGDDPALNVTDRNLQVHDTPGLYVFSGAVFPTCAGVNPTLTLWALTLRAAHNLVDRMGGGARA
ncbi:MAG: gluconate 2-dehydrogenase subunit 3 family protein [Thermomicrobiales bacterium]|nr:gluconate 2-dehydrogenase subunit 3 family protein [Thermomicrobiales bacterium]